MSLPGYLKVNRHELVTELQNIGKKRERKILYRALTIISQHTGYATPRGARITGYGRLKCKQNLSCTSTAKWQNGGL